MKAGWLRQLLLLAVGVVAGAARAESRLEILPELPLTVWGGSAQWLSVLISNRLDDVVDVEVRTVLSQVGGSIVAPVDSVACKRLKVLKRQVIQEFSIVEFPAVKAKTRFVVQWLEGTNGVFGTTEVWVYPTNLLARLNTLAGDEELGVFDPAGQLRPSLRAQGVRFQDLLENGTDKFQGKLVIVGPFEVKQQMRKSLSADVRALAKRGIAVVFFQAPRESAAALKPSFYTVREGDGAVVVAQNELVAQLAERPEAQLNLLAVVESVLRPVPLNLPETDN